MVKINSALDLAIRAENTRINILKQKREGKQKRKLKSVSLNINDVDNLAAQKIEEIKRNILISKLVNDQYRLININEKPIHKAKHKCPKIQKYYVPEMPHVKSFLKCKLKNALRLLNSKEPANLKQKQISRMCKRDIVDLIRENEDTRHTYGEFSPMRIVMAMRTCILEHDWENLTRLLVHEPTCRYYKSIFVKYNFMHLLYNKSAVPPEIFEEMLKILFSFKDDEAKEEFLNNIISLKTVKAEDDLKEEDLADNLEEDLADNLEEEDLTDSLKEDLEVIGML